MDKEPKRDEVPQDDIAEIRIHSIPLMVLFISRCLESYDEIMYGDDDDIDGGDDDDPHFGDHFNNLMK